MATYKVIQDIEAEDKLLGPLSLKQFIYAAIVLVTGFIAYKFASLSIFLVIPFLPVMLFFGLLAAPLGRDQPNEIWILARIRFFLKPRVRKWNQNGINQLVTITIPKKIEKDLTKGYSPTEAKSRLQALANTIDTRGWAVKNVNVNLYSQPSYFADQASSDRLIDPSVLPKEVPNADITAQDDIFEENNANAQHISTILSANEKKQQEYHKNLINNGVTEKEPQPDYWFMQDNTPKPVQPAGYQTFGDDPIVSPGAANDTTQVADDNSVTADLRDKIQHAHENRTKFVNGSMHVVEPLSHNSKRPKHMAPETSVTSKPVNAKIETLARDNNLSISSLAHEANKDNDDKKQPDEIVISLR